MNNELLAILACPKCSGTLQLQNAEKHLLCPVCQLLFPVLEGVPLLLLREAVAVAAKEVSPEEKATSMKEPLS